jgi:hypothetical protein
MSGPLPALVDRKTLAAELGVGRATVDVIFQRLEVIAFEGHCKVFVKRSDVERLLEKSTYDGRTRVR